MTQNAPKASLPDETSNVKPSNVNFLNSSTSAILSSFWLRPIPDVGPTCLGLRGVPNTSDMVEQPCITAKRYTTWDLFSRSYVTRISVSNTDHATPGHSMAPDEPEVAITVPTEYQLSQMRAEQKRAMRRGQMVFANNRLLSQADWRLYQTISGRRRLQFENLHPSIPAVEPVDPSEVESISGEASEPPTTFTTPTGPTTRSQTGAINKTPLVPPPAKKTASKKQATVPPVRSAQSRALEFEIEEPDPSFCNAVADNVPIRCVTTSSVRDLRQQTHTPDRTPLFQTLEAKITSTDSGCFGSVIRTIAARDLLSATVLVKMLIGSNGTALDVAPLLRLNCMAVSLDLDCYDTDITERQFIRGLKPARAYIKTCPTTESPPGTLIAMAFDQFTQYMSGAQPLPGGENFAPKLIDNTWTAIPVTNEILNNAGFVPYVISFLSSEYWSGTVSVSKHIDVSDPETDEAVGRGFVTTMPAINSVHIPGPLHGLLVLLDSDAANALPHVMFNDLRVPVWSRPIRVPEVPDLNPQPMGEAWERFWAGDWNVLCSSIFQAQNYFRDNCCVGDTIERASSLTAELYAAWRPGMAVPADADTPFAKYEVNEPALGGYGFTDREEEVVKLHWKSNLHLTAVPVNDIGDPEWPRKICGFNFASQSATHHAPNGYAPLTGIKLPRMPLPSYIWRHRAPQQFVQGYCTPVATSYNRLGIALKFYVNEEYERRFTHVGSFPAWIHMLAAALSASTSLFLTTNSLSNREWAGFATLNGASGSIPNITTIKDYLFRGAVMNNDMHYISRHWVGPNFNEILAYYALDPFHSMDWCSCSPVPLYFTLQWAQKMRTASCSTCLNKPDIVTISGRQLRGTPVLDTDGLGPKTPAPSCIACGQTNTPTFPTQARTNTSRPTLGWFLLQP